MTDAPKISPLQRAADGRLSTGSVLDPRTWQREYGPRGAAGMAPVGVMIAAFVVQQFTGGAPGWGWSAQALAEGRIHTLALHMLAQEGIDHLLVSALFMFVLTAAVMLVFGRGLDAWARWLALLALSGVAGALAFLAVHPAGAAPLVGTFGAICGLWGFAARLETRRGGLAPLWSPRVWRHIGQFLAANVILFAMAWGKDVLTGLAWEAHLGGFLAGLLLAPLFMPAALRQSPRHEPAGG